MKSFCTLVFFLLCFAIFAQPFNQEVVSKRLEEKLAAGETEYIDIYVLLADRVDVHQMNQAFSHQNIPLTDRAPELINALKGKANDTQTDLIYLLKNQSDIDENSIRPYWITNMIFFRASPDFIAELSYHGDIAWLDINADLELTNYSSGTFERKGDVEPDGIEPGLAAINAPAMWALGYTGYGRVAMLNDTGADPAHPSYKLKYRGIYVPEDEAWFQYNSGNTEPFDCSGHGSHVLGTMLGLDRQESDTIGVAFNSLWVGSPGIVCAYRGTEATVGALQWALDPDGNPTTISDMPDVINNSWYDPDDANECEGPYIDVFTALEAAGIAVVFSAGNEGPDPSTVSPPHNINIDLVNTFTVGALNANHPNLNIADFSSRGPSICGETGSLLIKPEVSAPGVNVRSAGLDGTYEYNSGTSMAAPHVSGAILLLKEAFPYLSGTELKLALYHTCFDLGEPGEDNIYGMGMIDVYAAFNYLIDQGHTPVDPHVEQDLILIGAEIDEYFCKGEAYSTVTIENGGMSMVNSFEINYNVEGSSAVSGHYYWSGNLAVGEQITIELPGLPVSSGAYNYSISVILPNNEADDRPLNNAYRQKIISIEDIYFEVSTDQLNENPICQGASALIRAYHDEFAVVKWYSSAEDEMPFATGNELLVDPINTTKTFYTGLTYYASTGLVDPDEMEYPDENGGGIVFDCYAPFRLKSVTVYAESPGISIVKLQTSDGMELASKTVLINQAGEREIELDLLIPKGNELVLKIDEGMPFSYSSGDIGYPFEIPSLLKIKRSNDLVEGDQRYYYLYDWKIEYDKFCGRIPVTVEVQESSDPPKASFIPSANFLDLDISGEIGFTDLSQGGTNWYWNFGDDKSSLISNPNHVYIDTGTFIVSQTVQSIEGCTDTAIDTIRVSGALVGVEDPGISDELISVFPVPTENLLNVRFDFHKSHDIQIRIFDVLGMEVLFLNEKAYYQETKKIDVSKLGQGIYFVAFTVEEHSIVKKILVQR